jgi:UDP-N-acetylmuramate-alanine ligase
VAVGDKAIAGGSLQSVAELIKKNAREDDMVVVMGAGDIFKVYKLLDLE